MRVTVIGAGYVGLVSGACFADFGVNVTCVDRDQGRISLLNSGGTPIYESGLDVLLQRNIESGRLSFTTDLVSAVPDADLIFIAVGTPSAKDGYPDMSQVEAVARQIAPSLSGYTVIVSKSTVPAGTGQWLQDLLQSLNPEADVDVASNPEFLREGSAIGDFMQPDRVVLGAETQRAAALLRELYRPLEARGAPIITTSRETAELIKYASNAFLATKITFINEMAGLCEKFQADVEVLARGMGLDKRIGPHFLRAGPGYGGSCFPKDTRALASIARRVGAQTTIVDTVIKANDELKRSMADRVHAALGGRLDDKSIAVLGVTFKADTDDMREAPSLAIIPALLSAGARVCAYDPVGKTRAEPLLPGVEWGDCPYTTAKEADAVIILTEWQEFRSLDLYRLRESMRGAIVVDLRNIFDPEAMRNTRFTYHSLGRPPIFASHEARAAAAAE